MIHDTRDGRNIYVIMKTVFPPGYPPVIMYG